MSKHEPLETWLSAKVRKTCLPASLKVTDMNTVNVAPLYGKTKV